MLFTTTKKKLVSTGSVKYLQVQEDDIETNKICHNNTLTKITIMANQTLLTDNVTDNINYIIA